jgi:hypothetical protein
MTLQENIDKYESNVRNFTVANLKADPEFMQACRDDVELREWVLAQRPDMRNEKQPKMKFLGVASSKGQVTDKSPQIEPEPVEKISKTAQIMKDLKAYKDKQGFI